MGKLKTYRCSFTLPCDLAVAISKIAKRLGMSQSALLAILLSEPIGELEKLVDLLPVETPDGVKRLRGASVDALRKAVHDARQLAAALDPELPL